MSLYNGVYSCEDKIIEDFKARFRILKDKAINQAPEGCGLTQEKYKNFVKSRIEKIMENIQY